MSETILGGGGQSSWKYSAMPVLGDVVSWVENARCASTELSTAQNRNSIIALQWLIAIATSYLVLADHKWTLTDPIQATLVLISLLSAPILQRLCMDMFQSRHLKSRLLVLNSILLFCAISLNQNNSWDLLLLFCFCVLIAASGENLLQIILVCTLLSITFVVVVPAQPAMLFTIDSSLWFRVPFMFGISVFYGYLVSQIKCEKKRVEKLEETERIKTQLVSAFAHDIKAPLSVILGHAELLAGSLGGEIDAKEKLFSLDRIRENINRIVKLVTGFLDIAKLQTVNGRNSRTMVQLNAIIEEVLSQQLINLRQKEISISLDLDSTVKEVLGDHEQLERVFWNLIGNAIKFTPAGGGVTVSSRTVKDQVSITVRDTGIGIAKDQMSVLFSEFQRLKGAAEIEGSGLGLFIVKAILDAHGGTISVESEEGVGTTFTVLIPTRRECPSNVQSEISRPTTQVNIPMEHAA